MRFLLALLLAGAMPASAQSFGPQPDSLTRAELLKLRDGAWRAWFSNDRAAFERIVPDELLAMGWDGGMWADRERTMARMREYAATGQRLTRLDFPANKWQRYGDVVLLYSTFELETTSKEGTIQRTTGRASEVFVRRTGRWVHTAWHLDASTP